MSNPTVNVTISRSSHDEIRISIADALSRLQIAEVSMAPEEFALCVTGLSFSKGILKSVVSAENAQHIGKARETEFVVCDRSASLRSDDQLRLVHEDFNKNYRDEGWKLQSDGTGTKQSGNHHRYSIYRYKESARSSACEITPEDLTIYCFNTKTFGFSIPNETGIGIVHRPTGIEVRCGTERSQHANREKALRQLADKLRDNASN